MQLNASLTAHAKRVTERPRGTERGFLLGGGGQIEFASIPYPADSLTSAPARYVGARDEQNSTDELSHELAHPHSKLLTRRSPRTVLTTGPRFFYRPIRLTWSPSRRYVIVELNSVECRRARVSVQLARGSRLMDTSP
jgi:hypothetical protein